MIPQFKVGDLAWWYSLGESHKVFVDAVWVPDADEDDEDVDRRDREITYIIVKLSSVQRRLSCTEEKAVQFCKNGLKLENRLEYINFLNANMLDSSSHWAYEDQLTYIGNVL